MWEGVEERVRSRNNVRGIHSKFSSDGYGISHKNLLNLLLVDWCHNQGQEGAATVTGRRHLTGAVIDRGPGVQITGRLLSAVSRTCQQLPKCVPPHPPRPQPFPGAPEEYNL